MLSQNIPQPLTLRLQPLSSMTADVGDRSFGILNYQSEFVVTSATSGNNGLGAATVQSPVRKVVVINPHWNGTLTQSPTRPIMVDGNYPVNG